MEGEREVYSTFCFKWTLTWPGCDLLDNQIGRLHTNFEISATLKGRTIVGVDRAKSGRGRE